MWCLIICAVAHFQDWTVDKVYTMLVSCKSLINEEEHLFHRQRSGSIVMLGNKDSIVQHMLTIWTNHWNSFRFHDWLKYRKSWATFCFRKQTRTINQHSVYTSRVLIASHRKIRYHTTTLWRRAHSKLRIPSNLQKGWNSLNICLSVRMGTNLKLPFRG